MGSGPGPRSIALVVDEPRALALTGELEPIYAGYPGAQRGAPAVFDAALLLAVAYPALASAVRTQPQDVAAIVSGDLSVARTRQAYIAQLAPLLGDRSDHQLVRAALRRFARRERMRIALREVLPRAQGGADVDATSRELAMLADATIEAALQEASDWARRRYGVATRSDGAPASFVVIGMGKLGGAELNAGSDVDLIYFYDVDEGCVTPLASDELSVGAPSISLQQYWQRVARRLTATLEDVTEDGQVWRVDLRLRPEGSTGPLVISLAAAERYYESFGRLWERAAMLRARPVAGDLALGDTLLEALSAFVWRRRIDPSVATELVQMVRRGRAELCSDPERDLKLGPGGIREAEFFVQALQLVWGGRDPSLRERGTLIALAQLESKGLCTQREAVDIADGYLALRRAEHAVQVTSGVQTHELPKGPALERIARMLGFSDGAAFVASLDEHRERVGRRFNSLVPEGGEELAPKWAGVLGALEAGDEQALREALGRALASDDVPFSFPVAAAEGDTDDRLLALSGNLFALGAHPDAVLGVRTRDSFPGLADTLLDALFEAADPLQAARYLRVFFDRVRQVAVYVRLLFADPAALRRLIGVLGASAFIGDALCNNPELGDMILFSRPGLTVEAASREVMSTLTRKVGADEDPDEAFVGYLRLAKTRLTLEVALADLSNDFSVRDVNHLLSAVADASLEAATQRALASPTPRGLSLIAMGKLGGREISYGSDLDVLFVFDPEAAPDPGESLSYFTRAARKIIRYISTFHGAGPGYELDTRLRPSGNQGLLVTSLEAFGRYHGVDRSNAAVAARAAVWERMALVRARPAAGDPELGQRALALARAAAFGPLPDAGAAAAEMRRIRERALKESSREREGVYDIKLGKGAQLDIEFVVQFLQITHGERLPEAAKSAETPVALEALGHAGILRDDQTRTLREAYAFLRRLELRVRVVRADASHVLETHSATLVPLARRMGMRDHPTRSAADTLLLRYRSVTDAVRRVFDEVFTS